MGMETHHAMKYMLLICTEAPGTVLEEQPDTPDIDAWVDEMDGRKIRQLGEQLAPASDATTVRVRGGKTMLTDGPFAETKEQICGFDIIECADLDEAIEVAARHPMAWNGMVEVRPFWTPPTPS
jgi:hypothetical protein